VKACWWCILLQHIDPSVIYYSDYCSHSFSFRLHLTRFHLLNCTALLYMLYTQWCKWKMALFLWLFRRVRGQNGSIVDTYRRRKNPSGLTQNFPLVSLVARCLQRFIPIIILCEITGTIFTPWLPEFPTFRGYRTGRGQSTGPVSVTQSQA